MLCAAYYPIDQLWHRALVEGVNEIEKVIIVSVVVCSCKWYIGVQYSSTLV